MAKKGKSKGAGKKLDPPRKVVAKAKAGAETGVIPETAAEGREATPIVQHHDLIASTKPAPEPAGTLAARMPDREARDQMPDRSGDPTSSEKRIWRRVPFFRKIQYKFDSMEAFRTEIANDLSLGGVFIKTDKPEAIGSVIFLEFDLKDGSRILAGYGKVVRVNPIGAPDFDPGMGVEFLKFDDESLVRIRQLIADRYNG